MGIRIPDAVGYICPCCGQLRFAQTERIYVGQGTAAGTRVF